jgi:hypothetical protein
MDDVWTTGRVAAHLGISTARVRRMAIDFNLGRLLGPRTRVYTGDDVAVMRARSTGKPGRPPKHAETAAQDDPGGGS